MKDNISKFLSGLLFGMMLQLAVGPVCLYLINTSIINGFFPAFNGIIAVVIIDAFYIILAVFGVSKFLNRKRTRNFKVFGGTVLILFGITMIFPLLDLTLNSHYNFISVYNKTNIFTYSLLLTLSNPLTIVFWSGIFSEKMINEKYNRTNLVLFAAGCLAATLLFLCFAAVLGSVIQRFFTPDTIKYLNSIVGLIIIILGIKMFFFKNNSIPG